MSEIAIESGRAALAAALARAGKRASTAAVVAAIVPLGMLAAPAPASAIICGLECVSSSVSPNGDVFNYTYNFSTSIDAPQFNRIELPEVRSGVYLSNGSGGFAGSIPAGWSVSEQSTTFFGTGGATFKAPNAAVNPGAFIVVVFTGGNGAQTLGGGEGFTLTLESSFGSSIASNAALGRGEFTFGTDIDPPTPNPVTPAPEPGTLALLGSALVGMAGLKRRKKV